MENILETEPRLPNGKKSVFNFARVVSWMVYLRSFSVKAGNTVYLELVQICCIINVCEAPPGDLF